MLRATHGGLYVYSITFSKQPPPTEHCEPPSTAQPLCRACLAMRVVGAATDFSWWNGRKQAGPRALTSAGVGLGARTCRSVVSKPSIGNLNRRLPLDRPEVSMQTRKIKIGHPE